MTFCYNSKQLFSRYKSLHNLSWNLWIASQVIKWFVQKFKFVKIIAIPFFLPPITFIDSRTYNFQAEDEQEYEEWVLTKKFYQYSVVGIVKFHWIDQSINVRPPLETWIHWTQAFSCETEGHEFDSRARNREYALSPKSLILKRNACPLFLRLSVVIYH